LLRVLQEGELERVGEERTRKVNVRLIAATNRDLRAEAEAGRFRQDLYYRLSVFPVELPPLRKRAEDIPLLAEHFLAQSARRLGRAKPRLTLANVQQLQRYPWPGNVRELQHVIERAVITAEGARLTIDLPARAAGPPGEPAAPIPAADSVLTDAEVRRLEADNIRRALRRAGGKVSGHGGAAELLGIKPTTLASRIKALGLSQQSAGPAGPQAPDDRD
jgi:transcriptional regulator with GAF, ATPase, and Fis domain